LLDTKLHNTHREAAPDDDVEGEVFLVQ